MKKNTGDIGQNMHEKYIGKYMKNTLKNTQKIHEIKYIKIQGKFRGKIGQEK
jgi:hypothetical protein